MEYENFFSPEQRKAITKLNSNEYRIMSDAIGHTHIWKPEKFKSHTRYERSKRKAPMEAHK